MWLVLWWTLPFLRACSMLADSELGDRQLPDQCSGAPGQIQWSVTKCDVVGPSDGASPLAEGLATSEFEVLSSSETLCMLLMLNNLHLEFVKQKTTNKYFICNYNFYLTSFFGSWFHIFSAYPQGREFWC